MRIPKSEFTDADMALCRAHSAELRRDMDERKDLMQEIPATELLAFLTVRAFEVGVHMPSDLPLPPSYWDDLEHWLKTLAPAKPAAPKPCQEPARPAATVWRTGPMIQSRERIGLWHVRHGERSGSSARHANDLRFDFSEYRPAAPGTKEGDPYDESKYATADLTVRLASTSSAADGAALVGAKLTHSVCIKAHGFADWHVGEIWPCHADLFSHPDNWRACDAAGWIPHHPTADSVCPVPDGVRFEARYGDGTPVASTESTRRECVLLWKRTDGSDPTNDIVAWRPIAKAAG